LNQKTGPCRSKAVLDEIAELLRKAYGRDIYPFDETFLAQSLEKRLAAMSIDTAAAYVERLTHDGAEAEAFFHSLNIGYSEFFRDPLVFALLEQVVLPGLAHEMKKSGRAEIRVWSAGCSAGQEAWSVAILLEELTAAREYPIPFRIIATDVSEAELAAARRGEYAASALQNVPLKHIQGYFSRHGETYRIVDRIKDRVDFSFYDLLDRRSSCPPISIFGEFDMIFCCNLLFYYRPDIRRFILGKMRCCLSPKGYLVTGEIEKAFVEEAGGFRTVAPPAAVFKKKNHG